MNKVLCKIVVASMMMISLMSQTFAQTKDSALDMVETSVSVALNDLKANKATYEKNPAALNRMIDTKMVPYFDTDVMAKYVLGKNWKSATTTQRKDFYNEFKQLIMRTYSNGLLGFTNAKVRYGEPSSIVNNRTKVKVDITNNAGKTFRLELSLHYHGGKWQGYDVSMDGLSVITSYRSSIGQEVAQKGIQNVINKMKALNAKGEVLKK